MTWSKTVVVRTTAGVTCEVRPLPAEDAERLRARLVRHLAEVRGGA